MYSEGAFACTDVQCIHVHTLYEVFLCFRLFSHVHNYIKYHITILFPCR